MNGGWTESGPYEECISIPCLIISGFSEWRMVWVGPLWGMYLNPLSVNFWFQWMEYGLNGVPMRNVFESLSDNFWFQWMEYGQRGPYEECIWIHCLLISGFSEWRMVWMGSLWGMYLNPCLLISGFSEWRMVWMGSLWGMYLNPLSDNFWFQWMEYGQRGPYEECIWIPVC